MKIPFDIKHRDKIENGEYKVETYSGYPVIIYRWDYKDKYNTPILGSYIFEDGYEYAGGWDINGKFEAEASDFDLVIITGEEEPLTPLAELLSTYLKNDFEYFTTKKWDKKKWNEVMKTQATELQRVAYLEKQKEQKPESASASIMIPSCWEEKQKENPRNAISIPADCASNAKCPYKINGDEDFIGDIKDTPAYHFGFDEGVRSEREKQKPVDYDHEMWKNCEANFEGGKKEVIDHPEKYGLQKEQKPCLTCDEYDKGYKQGYTEGCTAGYNNAMKEPEDRGEISDGYHTFNELYYYRMLYNAAFFNLLPKELVHKSKRHHDGEECFCGGWFVVMANLPTGQISNHYELKDWDLFQIPEKEVADEWDGHTPQEAAERIHEYLLERQKEQKPTATINGEPIPTENQSVDIPLAEWSEEDNIGWDEAFACVTRAEKAAKNEEELQNAVTAEKWLKEIKFKYYVHTAKQEWSEDEAKKAAEDYADEYPGMMHENDGSTIEDYDKPYNDFMAGVLWAKNQGIFQNGNTHKKSSEEKKKETLDGADIGYGLETAIDILENGFTHYQTDDGEYERKQALDVLIFLLNETRKKYENY